jgi:hypothetical protein
MSTDSLKQLDKALRPRGTEAETHASMSCLRLRSTYEGRSKRGKGSEKQPTLRQRKRQDVGQLACLRYTRDNCHCFVSRAGA